MWRTAIDSETRASESPRPDVPAQIGHSYVLEDCAVDSIQNRPWRWIGFNDFTSSHCECQHFERRAHKLRSKDSCWVGSVLFLLRIAEIGLKKESAPMRSPSSFAAPLSRSYRLSSSLSGQMRTKRRTSATSSLTQRNHTNATQLTVFSRVLCPVYFVL
jgi:hypothetical protein